MQTGGPSVQEVPTTCECSHARRPVTLVSLWEGAVYLVCWQPGLRPRWAVEEPLGWSPARLGPEHVVLTVTWSRAHGPDSHVKHAEWASEARDGGFRSERSPHRRVCFEFCFMSVSNSVGGVPGTLPGPQDHIPRQQSRDRVCAPAERASRVWGRGRERGGECGRTLPEALVRATLCFSAYSAHSFTLKCKWLKMTLGRG